MQSARKPDPTIIIIFGGGGDLCWRKLMPAIYNLYLDNWLPDNFAVVGLDIKEMSDDQFRERILDGINQFSRRGKVIEEQWKKFASFLSYQKADFTNNETYQRLSQQLINIEKPWGKKSNRVFYLAIPPSFIEAIIENLNTSHIAQDDLLDRIVIEKPFGHDLDSARKLNKIINSIFDECQIYRIDHYLGKETVQNMMAFRFANALF
ncbi:MAG TPA: hypothetical protein VMV32_09610, partial [Ignavibacteriaceae bacterium]|nr:hypothetical protein [Ignavibacteriaceae bacterium]